MSVTGGTFTVFISQSTLIFLFLKQPHRASVFFDTVIPRPPLGAEAGSACSLRSLLARRFGSCSASHKGHHLVTETLEENEFLILAACCLRMQNLIFIRPVDDTAVSCLTMSTPTADKAQMMYLFVTRSLLCFSGNFQGFGVLTLPYDISRLVFLLFILLRTHYWVHHGMICFEGFFLCHNFSNTACLFRLRELLKYALNLPSSSVSWTLCCAFPSLGNPEDFPLTQFSPELCPVDRLVQFSHFLGPLAPSSVELLPFFPDCLCSF